MLTRSGKIVFSVMSVVLIVIITTLFLKSTPDSSIPHLSSNVDTSTFNPSQSMLDILNKPLREFGVDAEKISDTVYFSPDSRYVLFQAEKTLKEDDTDKTPLIIFVDISKGVVRKIHDGAMSGVPSWSHKSAAFTSGEVYLYTFETGILDTISPTGSHPVLSLDGSVVAYEDRGISIFSTMSRASIVLTNDSLDGVGMWTDDTTLLIFKNEGTPMGEELGKKQYVAVIDSVTKNITQLQSVSRGRFFGAELVGKYVRIIGGYDDGTTEYLVDLSKDISHTILEKALSNEVVIDKVNSRMYILENNFISEIDTTGTPLGRVELVDFPKVENNHHWFKVMNDRLYVGYTTGSSGQVEIGTWDTVTGQKNNTPLETDSSAVFFSNSDLVAFLSEDQTQLVFKMLK